MADSGILFPLILGVTMQQSQLIMLSKPLEKIHSRQNYIRN